MMKNNVMKNKAYLPALGFLMVLGATGILRFSGQVRTVDTIGLFFSGMACGAALVALVTHWRFRNLLS